MGKLYTLSIFLCIAQGLFITAKAQQWERLPQPSPTFDFSGTAGNVTCIATNDTFVWIGTGNSGIFRTDAQFFANWQPANNGIQTFTIFSLNYTNGLLVATTQRGVYKSTDYGSSWVAINEGLPINKTITAFASVGGTLLVSTSEYGVFSSADNGQTWEKANNGLLDNNILDLGTDGTNFWALTLNAGLYKSTDKAQSWQPVTIAGGCAKCFQLELVDNTLFLAGGNILVSHNGGSSWSADTTLKNITGIVAYKGRLMAHNNYRVYESTDTGKIWLLDWEYNTDSSQTINTVLATPLDVKYIATQNHGIYRGAVAAITWKPYNSGLVTANAQKIEWFEGALLTVAYGKLFRSFDNGQTWTDISPGGTPVNHFITAAQPAKQLLVATDGGVYITDYSLINWIQPSGFLSGQPVAKLFDIDGSYYALADSGIYYSPLKNNIHFALLAKNIDTLKFTELAIANGLLYAGTTGGLFSAADGKHFERVDSTNLPRRYVYFLREINGKIWMKIGIDTHVSDDGVIWPRYYYIGGITFANSISVVENRIYASTTAGYMYSDSAIDDWKTIATIEGLEANVFAQSDSFLFAGTGAGIWRMKISDIGTATPAYDPNIPFTLYPNPATSTFSINSGTSLETVAIYTLSGQKIAECNGCDTFAIHHLPPGMYIVQATTSRGVYTQKLLKE